jgi:hypothetical protein
MENEEKQFENLENLTQEELDALEAKQNAEAEEAEEDAEPTIDYKSKFEAAERKAATLQRILNKKGGKTINKTNQDDFAKDILEIKHNLRIDVFAEENGLTKSQARKVFEINSNPTSDILKDPFIAEGLKAIARKDRVDSATPAGGRATTVNGKSFKEMSEEDRKANYSKLMQG